MTKPLRWIFILLLACLSCFVGWYLGNRSSEREGRQVGAQTRNSSRAVDLGAFPGAGLQRGSSPIDQATEAPLPPPLLTPELQNELGVAMAKETKIRAHALATATHATFFKQLNLPAAVQEKIISTISEREGNFAWTFLNRQDDKGNPIPPTREEFMSHRGETENLLRLEMGDAVYSKYQDYSKSLPERSLLETFKKASPVPVTEEQAEGLVSILFKHRETEMKNGPDSKNVTGSISAIKQDAAAILSPDQLGALEETVMMLTRHGFQGSQN